jgi:hypothetical protein
VCLASTYACRASCVHASSARVREPGSQGEREREGVVERERGETTHATANRRHANLRPIPLVLALSCFLANKVTYICLICRLLMYGILNLARNWIR